jgi:F0F1-type ATP synthase assembly protein I
VQSTSSAMQQAAPYLGLGFQLAITVIICGGAGYWIDTTYGTSPFGLLVGVVTGSTVGLIQFLRSVQRLSQNRKQHESSEKER